MGLAVGTGVGVGDAAGVAPGPLAPEGLTGLVGVGEPEHETATASAAAQGRDPKDLDETFIGTPHGNHVG
jgi:hypothetical protein